MGLLEQHKLTAVGIISAIVLISSFSLGFILEPEEVVFIPDKNSMINDVEQLVSKAQELQVQQQNLKQQNTLVKDLMR